MGIIIKTAKEVELMKKGGQKLGEILQLVASKALPGVAMAELDELAEALIREAGAEPAFKGYCSKFIDKPFPTTLCTSINHEIVHAPATPSRILKEGDIVGIDVGMRFPAKTGLYTDTAVTVGVGKLDKENQLLIDVTKKALDLAIEKVKPGNFISDISKVIQDYVEKQGFSVVRALVGHGVGRQIHEEPRIPNFYESSQPKIELKKGMTIAIEPMVNLGGSGVKTLEDGWTVVTADGSRAAHFEHSVAVTKDGCQILTAP